MPVACRHRFLLHGDSRGLCVGAGSPGAGTCLSLSSARPGPRTAPTWVRRSVHHCSMATLQGGTRHDKLSHPRGPPTPRREGSHTDSGTGDVPRYPVPPCDRRQLMNVSVMSRKSRRPCSLRVGIKHLSVFRGCSRCSLFGPGPHPCTSTYNWESVWYYPKQIY